MQVISWVCRDDSDQLPVGASDEDITVRSEYSRMVPKGGHLDAVHILGEKLSVENY